MNTPDANEAPRLEAVIEAPWYEGAPPWPWPVAGLASFRVIRLWEGLSEPEVGLVAGQLISYNDHDGNAPLGDAATALRWLASRETIIAPGGIRALAPELAPIEPGCCCGIETWREWNKAPSRDLWLGHDPAPWTEGRGSDVLVWSDGGVVPLDDPSKAFAITFSYTQFRAALESVERDLQAFLILFEVWACGVSDGELAAQVSRAIDTSFQISAPT